MANYHRQIMKSYIKSALFALAAPMLMTACSSDSNNEPTPAPEQFEGIQLAIPSYMLPTRAENDIRPTENEAKINTLTIVAYKQNDNNAKTPVIIRKSGSELSTTASPIFNEYSSVNVGLAKGDYHIYLFANIEDNALTKDGATFSANMEEADFKALSLSADALIQDAAVNGNQTKYLPMSCYYTDVKADANETDFTTPGLVTIQTGKATAVYANLTLAVSKVKISLSNNKSAGVTINAPELANLANSLSAFNDNPAKLAGAQKATINGKFFNLGSAFNNDATPDWSKVDLAALRGEELSEVGSNLWTWFGEAFICERLYAENDSKVTLNITHSSGDSSSTDLNGTTGVGFQRSYCYEIVGKIDSKTVSLQVRVKPWVYNKNVIDLE